jgi:hypothetical protein
MRALLLALALAACGKGGGDTVENISGTAKVGGVVTEITACKPRTIGKEVFASFTLASGHTLLMSSGLDNEVRIGKGSDEPVVVECPTRSGMHGTEGEGGGASVDGDVKLVCMHASGEISLEVKYACGAKPKASSEY